MGVDVSGLGKRIAEVPQEALDFAEGISKADLLEAAWHLASLCNGADSCEDDAATMQRLYEEINALRAGRGARELPPLGQLRAKWIEWGKNRAALVARFRGGAS